jgi:acyl-CoA reductase-like NAD-dependent aldehyde dehydrogenase
VTLELGGKSPQIVFADADLDAALPALVNAIVQNAGQTCSAGSRVLVEQSRYEELLSRLGEKFAGAQDRTALADLACGPLIRGSQLQRVRAFLADAAKDGIAIVAAGAIVADAPSGGFYAAPTLLRDVPVDNRLACDEVFGPVLAAMSFVDEADAFAWPTRRTLDWWPACGRRTEAGNCAWRAPSGAGRCSSTTTAPAAAWNCHSAASSIRATAAKRDSRRCTDSRRSRPL